MHSLLLLIPGCAVGCDGNSGEKKKRVFELFEKTPVLVKAFMIPGGTVHWRAHIRTLQHAPSSEILATCAVRTVQVRRGLQRVWVVCGLKAWTVLPGSGQCTSQSNGSKVNFTLQWMNKPYFIFRHTVHPGLILCSVLNFEIYLHLGLFFSWISYIISLY